MRIEVKQARPPVDRSMQRGARIIEIRCGADIKPQPITRGPAGRYWQNHSCAGAGGSQGPLTGFRPLTAQAELA